MEMNYVVYSDALSNRIAYLIDLLDHTSIKDFDPIIAEIKVLDQLRTVAENEMHKAD